MAEAWNNLLPRLSSTCASQAKARTPELTVDLAAPIGSRSPIDLAALADHLAPTGMGNPEPTFLLREVPLTAVRLVGDGRHARLTLSLDGAAVEAMRWVHGGLLGLEAHPRTGADARRCAIEHSGPAAA